MQDDLVEIPAEKIDKYTPEELETVQYLEYCIDSVNEKGMLARFIWQQIAFGRITAHDVAVVLGAYDPEGIQLDEGATFDGWSADPAEILSEDDDQLDSDEPDDVAALPAAVAVEDDTVETHDAGEETPSKE